MSSKNVTSENDIDSLVERRKDIRKQQADVADVADSQRLLDIIRSQFEDATAVVLHGKSPNASARLTDPCDITAPNDTEVDLHCDTTTIRVSTDYIKCAASNDRQHADLPLGSRLTICYDSANSQHSRQTRTGIIVDWLPKRLGGVFKFTLETSSGERYHVGISTRGVQKGPRPSARSVGSNAEISVHDTDADRDGDVHPDAHMGRVEKKPRARKKPKRQFLERLDADESERTALSRAYLVELRVCEKTWKDSHESSLFVELYYTTSDTNHYYVQTTDGVATSDGDDGYELTADEELVSSILVAGDGNPQPDAVHGLAPSDIRAQHRRVLRDEHGLNLDGADQ